MQKRQRFGNGIRIVLVESLSAFSRNKGLTMASSLAFSAMLALIPAFFLLTVVLGSTLGSSDRALQQTREIMVQLVPGYSEVIVDEVYAISGNKQAIGLLNVLVLFWSTTPLVAGMRISLGTIFGKKPAGNFLSDKLRDMSISMLFLAGFAMIASAGVVLTLLERTRPLVFMPGYIDETIFFILATAAVAVVYFTFSGRSRFTHLLAGAMVASALWFLLRPAFHTFLIYNPGYGFAFGSFKSLFVVVIWIYISLVLLLFGAEVSACIGRDQTFHLKSLVEGRRNVPPSIADRHVLCFQRGSVIFNEGDDSHEMYFVLKGSVSVRKAGQEIDIVSQGGVLGGLSFLLSSSRVSMAVADSDLELVILNNENINNLMNQFPELVVSMLRGVAQRLRQTSCMVD